MGGSQSLIYIRDQKQYNKFIKDPISQKQISKVERFRIEGNILNQIEMDKLFDKLIELKQLDQAWLIFKSENAIQDEDQQCTALCRRIQYLEVSDFFLHFNQPLNHLMFDKICRAIGCMDYLLSAAFKIGTEVGLIQEETMQYARNYRDTPLVPAQFLNYNLRSIICHLSHIHINWIQFGKVMNVSNLKKYVQKYLTLNTNVLITDLAIDNVMK